MIKKTQLAFFAAMVLSCSVSYGQAPLTPSSLGLSSGDAIAAGTTFNIGNRFGLADTAVQLLIGNADGSGNGANVANGADLWTVSNQEPATFRIVSSTTFNGFIQHGGVLGSPSAQNSAGGVSTDGFTAAAGEDYTLVSTLDSDYTASVNTVSTAAGNLNVYGVTYTGDDTGNIESNPSAFRYVSDQPITAFTVTTTNNANLDNNFSFGIGVATVAIPEPTGAALLAFASTFCLMRRRRS